MTGHDERRDVAGRLRDSIPADLHLGRGNKAWGLLYLTLFGRYMPNQASGRTYKQVAELLADLIEPNIPADPGEAGLASVDGFIREMRHSTKEEQDEYTAMLEKMSVGLHPVDRDALLALADEMEIDGAGALDDGDWCKPLLVEYARRIREALGVDDD